MRRATLPIWMTLLILPFSVPPLALGQAPQPGSADVGEATSDVASASVLEAPYLISFQGFLEDNGSPANGLYDFVFRLRDFPTAGIQKWVELQNDVQVTDGIYNVLLGSSQTLATVDFDDDLWLAIEVNEAPEILPRPQIVGTPFSFMSFEALDLRLPAEISGVANVDGTKLLTITNEGTGDVLEIDGNDTSSDGIEVTNIALNGIEVLSPGQNGVVVSGTGGIGFWASGPGGDGLLVQSAGGDGVQVSGAADFAFRFEDVPDSFNGGLTAAYVGLIRNTSTNASSDVLALQVETPGNPGTAANFVGFFDGDDDLIGQIEGNAAGGVAYNTTGADYAEYLPHLSRGEEFSGGDVVGVFDGKISLRTVGAQQVMAITDRAAVLGNAPKGMDEVVGYEPVSFIGQVLVRVTGIVSEGDYIVASGREDGTGIAVSPADITLDDVERLVGRAWESSTSAETKRINTVVGLDRSEVFATIIRRQSTELSKQEKAIEELRIILEQHMRQHTGL